MDRAVNIQSEWSPSQRHRRIYRFHLKAHLELMVVFFFVRLFLIFIYLFVSWVPPTAEGDEQEEENSEIVWFVYDTLGE